MSRKAISPVSEDHNSELVVLPVNRDDGRSEKQRPRPTR